MDASQPQTLLVAMPNPLQQPRSHQVVSHQEWEIHRNEIYKIYIKEQGTLNYTMKIMEDLHNFKASERAYKMKLKEWKFEKNLGQTDMMIIVAKAAERFNRNGKETVFKNAGQPLSAERIENFKKRIASRSEEMAFPDAETPPNITYYTPKSQDSSDVPEVIETDIGRPLENHGVPPLTAASNEGIQPSTAIANDISSLRFEQLNFTEGKDFRLAVGGIDEFFGHQTEGHNPDTYNTKTMTPNASEFSVYETTDLARMHEAEGNLDEAAAEYTRILDGYARGKVDPKEILKINYRLAGIHQSQVKLDKAADLYRHVADGYEKIFGKSALETLRARYGLAKVLEQKGKYHEAESLYLQAAEGFKNLGLVEHQMDCQFHLADLLRDKGLHFKAVGWLRTTLLGYQNIGLHHRMFAVLGSLLDSYVQMDQKPDVNATISRMRKLLSKGLQMDHNLFPEYLIEGIHLATILSTEEYAFRFRAAESVFSAIIPKLELLSDTKYSLEKFYGYLEFGLHYKRHHKWSQAAEYLHLAYKSPITLEAHNFSVTQFVHINLVEVQMQFKDVWHSPAQKDARDRALAALVQSNQSDRHDSGRGQHERPGVGQEGDEGESIFGTDTSSCKYGLTYSVSDITGISDSRFMIP